MRYRVECQDCDYRGECNTLREAVELRKRHEEKQETQTHNVWLIDRNKLV